MKFKKNSNHQFSPHFNSNELDCNCSLSSCLDQLVDIRILNALEKVRALVGRSIAINRCYSCIDHNRAIGGALNSNHCKGLAVDIRDIDGSIKDLMTEQVLKELDLYMEHPSKTKGWCHLQVIPPKSGNRIFLP